MIVSWLDMSFRKKFIPEENFLEWEARMEGGRPVRRSRMAWWSLPFRVLGSSRFSCLPCTAFLYSCSSHFFSLLTPTTLGSLTKLEASLFVFNESQCFHSPAWCCLPLNLHWYFILLRKKALPSSEHLAVMSFSVIDWSRFTEISKCFWAWFLFNVYSCKTASDY